MKLPKAIFMLPLLFLPSRGIKFKFEALSEAGPPFNGEIVRTWGDLVARLHTTGALISIKLVLYTV
ncbi:MAG: hypothetical protein HGA93_02710 [Methanothrix sp.]|nr:hypothetical protein [Methanothrix sp.]